MTYIQKSTNFSDYQFNVDTTNFVKQAIATTVIGYSGTEITYTPTLGSSKVIYEVNFTLSWDPDTSGSYPCTRVQYSSDNGVNWNTISGTEVTEGTFSSAADYDWMNMSYTFILDSWAGSRKIRLAGRAYSSSSEFTIGRQYYAAGSEGVSACPHVSIYSVNS